MANTLSVMTNVLRNVVSKQRIRYKEGGYNLDLAYICDNIIAMGYPADKIESIYRNRLEDVYRFLEDYHHDHYKIYNLCLERSYDINRFHKRVAVFPFEDHNPPTIELIQRFCNDVDAWLKKDRNNVAAVHCKAGKGRTGTMICCYLLYSGQQTTAEDALAFYDEKRTKDRKGVTIPSQRRYVQYFSILVRSGFSYRPLTLKLYEIHFGEASHLQNQGTVNCSISCLQQNSSSIRPLSNMPLDFRKTSSLDLSDLNIFVSGDIRVEITHKTSRKSFLHFWFNTYFVCGTGAIEKDSKIIYTLNKWEIDDVHKDKDHKFFSEDFKVLLMFGKTNFDGMEIPNASNYSEACRFIEDSHSSLQNNVAKDGLRNARTDIYYDLDAEESINDNNFVKNVSCCESTTSDSNNLLEKLQPHHLPVLKDSFAGKGMHNACLQVKEDSILNNSEAVQPRGSHGYQVDDLSEKLDKTTIYDDNLSKNVNSNMSQLQISRNERISSEFRQNSSIVGEGNLVEDWESGESSVKQLQQNVLLSSVDPSTSAHCFTLKHSMQLNKIDPNDSSRLINNFSSGQIEYTYLNGENSNSKLITRLTNKTYNGLTSDSAMCKTQTFRDDPQNDNYKETEQHRSFVFLKKVGKQVQNKYFKHKNFFTYKNKTLPESKETYTTANLKYNRVISSKHKHKIKLKDKNNRIKKFKKYKNYFTQTSQISRFNDNKCLIFLKNQNLVQSCSTTSILDINPKENKCDIDFFKHSEDIYSSECDNQLSSDSSPCKHSRPVAYSPFNSEDFNTILTGSSIVIADHPIKKKGIGFHVTTNSKNIQHVQQYTDKCNIQNIVENNIKDSKNMEQVEDFPD